jgi:hypothetical protein
VDTSGVQTTINAQPKIFLVHAEKLKGRYYITCCVQESASAKAFLLRPGFGEVTKAGIIDKIF